MPTWIMLSTLTPEGVQTVKNNPRASARSTRRSSSSAPPSRRSGRRSATSTSSTSSRRPTRRRMARVSLELGLARHGPLRDAGGDPHRRVHRLDLSTPRRPWRRPRGGPCWRTVPADSLPGTTIRGSAVRQGLDEGSRRRLRRPRARARAGARSARRARPEVLCAPGNAGIRGEARAAPTPIADDVEGLARAGRARRTSTWSSSAPRRRWSPASPTRWPPRACAASGRRRGRRAARGLQGVRQGDHGGRRRADRRPPRGHDRRGRASPRSTATRPSIKADGLAAGKGVVIAPDEAAARAALEDMLVERRFGDAARSSSRSSSTGDELSLLALCDGERALPLAPARDFKRIGDGDTGPNTGGMGSFSPVAEVGPELVEQIRATVQQPVVDELRAPRHAVPRRPLRRADADRRRARRCSSSTCASATPRRRPCCRGCAATCSTCCCARPSPAALAGVEPEWDERCAVTRRAGLARLPGVVVHRATSSRGLDERPGRRRGHPRGHRPSATATSSRPAGGSST